MNQRDKNNLEFIMNLSESQIKTWWDSISEDDRDYALELINNHRKELTARSINYAIDLEIVNLDAARKVLSKWCNCFE